MAGYAQALATANPGMPYAGSTGPLPLERSAAPGTWFFSPLVTLQQLAKSCCSHGVMDAKHLPSTAGILDGQAAAPPAACTLLACTPPACTRAAHSMCRWVHSLAWPPAQPTTSTLKLPRTQRRSQCLGRGPVPSGPCCAGLGDRLQVVEGKVEELQGLPQVDVLVSEPMGTLLVNERMLETYLYARDHFLKPGGRMFPVSLP